MDTTLHSIEEFIAKHHVLTLATCVAEEISACSLFYVYDADSQNFIVASAKETVHIRHIEQHNKVAGNIVLETDEVGKIQGLQFRGTFLPEPTQAQKKLYFKRYPYALAIQPTLWRLEVAFFKLTDNRLGFGKKLTWRRS